MSDRPRKPSVLPDLVTVPALARELGISLNAAIAISRLIPEQRVPGHRRSYMRRSDVARVLDENYHHKQLTA